MLSVKTVIYLLLLCVVGFIGLAYLIVSWTPDSLSYDIGILRWVGMIPMLLGLGLIGYYGYLLVFWGKGTPAPYDPPRVLVTQGLYKIVRNPGYLAGFVAMLGESVVLQSLALLAFTLVMWLFVHIFVVLFEEPGLQRRYGSSYVEYCEIVPRWFPRVNFKGTVKH